MRTDQHTAKYETDHRPQAQSVQKQHTRKAKSAPFDPIRLSLQNDARRITEILWYNLIRN